MPSKPPNTWTNQGDGKSRDGRKQVKAGKGGKISTDGTTHHDKLSGGEEFPAALDENDPNHDHGDQPDKPVRVLLGNTQTDVHYQATDSVDDIGDYFEQQSIFDAAAAAPAADINELTGTWQVVDNGDMETFMEAIGVSWLKRKAALAVTSMSTQIYKIDVDVANKTVKIDNGKSENIVQCDGSEFTYKSSQGDALTTASIDGGRFVMTHKGTEESGGSGMITSRYVENGQLIQEVRQVEKNITWKRTCKRITDSE